MTWATSSSKLSSTILAKEAKSQSQLSQRQNRRGHPPRPARRHHSIRMDGLLPPLRSHARLRHLGQRPLPRSQRAYGPFSHHAPHRSTIRSGLRSRPHFVLAVCVWLQDDQHARPHLRRGPDTRRSEVESTSAIDGVPTTAFALGGGTRSDFRCMSILVGD